MNKQITTYLIVGILCIVIGLLLHPVFFEKTEPPIVIPVAPDSTFMTGAPDTVWTEAEIIYVPKYTYRDTGSTRYDTVRETTYVAVERTVINSYKYFKHSDFTTSKIWTKSAGEVFDIDNEVIVEWQEHYEAEYEPQIKADIKRRNENNLLKATAAMALAAGGAATGEWEIALVGIGLGGIVIIAF